MGRFLSGHGAGIAPAPILALAEERKTLVFASLFTLAIHVSHELIDGGLCLFLKGFALQAFHDGL